MRLIDADAFKRQVAAAAIQNGFAKAAKKGNVLLELIDMQPTGIDWIPVEERLPTKNEYLENDGRFILDDGNRRYQGLFDFHDGKFKFSRHISGLNFELFEDKCVLAWMPLPEPYRLEQREE